MVDLERQAGLFEFGGLDHGMPLPLDIHILGQRSPADFTIDVLKPDNRSLLIILEDKLLLQPGGQAAEVDVLGAALALAGQQQGVVELALLEADAAGHLGVAGRLGPPVLPVEVLVVLVKALDLPALGGLARGKGFDPEFDAAHLDEVVDLQVVTVLGQGLDQQPDLLLVGQILVHPWRDQKMSLLFHPPHLEQGLALALLARGVLVVTESERPVLVFQQEAIEVDHHPGPGHLLALEIKQVRVVFQPGHAHDLQPRGGPVLHGASDLDDFIGVYFFTIAHIISVISFIRAHNPPSSRTS